MRRLLTRRFTVDAEPPQAWHTLITAEQWPTWAHHLRRVKLTPPGPVGPDSRATLTLRNRSRARVTVTEFVGGSHFRWDGTFLWFRLGYDHLVEPADHEGSHITFSVEGDGAGASSLGRLFARIYARSLDRAIPRLQHQLATATAHADAPTANS